MQLNHISTWYNKSYSNYLLFFRCFTSVHMLTDLSPVLTYFYICSDCYYSHPTIYCKFCSWTKFLHGRINLSKNFCYFVRCFISLHISTELIPVCNLVLHCSDCYSSHATIYCKFCSYTTFSLGTINLAKII